MKNLKSRKNRKGFTLVELIVVIAILAILAGVAIPVYSGYIKEANKAADLASLDAVKTAAVSAYVMAQKDAATAVSSISYTSGDETATVNGTEVTITAFTSAVTLKTGSSADWANDAWTINN